MNPTHSLQDLKLLIETTQDIPVFRQRMIYRGKVLKAGSTLADYGIEDGDAIHLIVMKNPPPSSDGAESGDTPYSSGPSVSSASQSSSSFSSSQSFSLPGQHIMMGTVNISEGSSMPDLNQLVSDMLSSVSRTAVSGSQSTSTGSAANGQNGHPDTSQSSQPSNGQWHAFNGIQAIPAGRFMLLDSCT